MLGLDPVEYVLHLAVPVLYELAVYGLDESFLAQCPDKAEQVVVTVLLVQQLLCLSYGLAFPEQLQRSLPYLRDADELLSVFPTHNPFALFLAVKELIELHLAFSCEFGLHPTHQNRFLFINVFKAPAPPPLFASVRLALALYQHPALLRKYAVE